jgi:hypothetical protein
MKVRIIQLLCPERHCVLALAYESSTGEADPEKSLLMEAEWKKLVENRQMNPWCGGCRSRALALEDSPTIFTTLEEARPFLTAAEKAQADMAARWKAGRN